MKKENARPVLSVSFYNELAKEKGVVLMLGELANSDGPLSLKDAQNLIYQLQIFYVTGKDSQTKMVERFWENPTEFNYEDLIASLQTL
jgi:ATP synthase F1 complex assembly factor 1